MINKINLILVFLTTCTLSLTAQQQAQYTQWMFNKQSLNSGYVVSDQYTSVSVLHRSQWAGLEGAPTSQSINLKVPFKDKNIGLGSNFGVGLYYNTPKFFIGLSVPHILEGDLTFFDTGSNTVKFSREETHSYLMAGAILTLNDALKLKPSILFKHVANSPFDFDLHSSLIFYDTFWAGLTYRFGGIGESVGESIDLVLQLQMNNTIRIGFAYDFTLSKVKDFNDGTFELVIDYSLNPNQGKLTNPRFF